MDRGLSERQLDYVRLLCEDLEEREIAARLMVSYGTCHNMLERIRVQLNCRTRLGVAVWYTRRTSQA